MNIVRLDAGLGNQMFQYAFYCALKAVYGDTKIDISEYKYRRHQYGYELEKIFNVAPSYASARESNAMVDMSKSLCADIRRKIFKRTYKGNGELIEEKESRFQPELLNKTNAYFVGFWQSEKYFSSVENIVRQEFTFRNELDEKNRQIAEEIKNSTAVAVHIRCGSTAKRRCAAPFGYICTPPYYKKAIDYIESKTDNPRFFIFSNEPAFAKEKLTLPANVVFVDINHGKNSYKDMQLMSLCKHNIVANSSFSWWAAWLNANAEKIVVSPDLWLHDGEMPDIIPETWKRIRIDSANLSDSI